MTETFISKRRKRMLDWMDAHPHTLFTSGYDETITDEEANMLLRGDFDAFHDSLMETVMEWELDGYLWDTWEDDFARAFGYDAWTDMPERIQEFARENRSLNMEPWVRDMIRNKRSNVTATILKPGAKWPENRIYAPDMSGREWSEWDHATARYIIEAFGVELQHQHGPKVERLAHDLEVVYGGYDRESLTLCGRVDLWAIYEARKAPTHVIIGPEDRDHLLFYEVHNGCGNMGTMKLTRTRKMPAEFRVDGSYGYGVDSCYGFTGEWWRHEIRIA